MAPPIVDLKYGKCQYCPELRSKNEKHPDNVRLAEERKQQGAKGRAPRLCDDCGHPIPIYLNMGGSGFESASPGHFHLGKIKDLKAKLPIMRELCGPCYLLDYAKQFPDLPLPTLPAVLQFEPQAPPAPTSPMLEKMRQAAGIEKMPDESGAADVVF